MKFHAPILASFSSVARKSSDSISEMTTKDIIKAARLRMKMTEEDFANLIGVSRGSVQQWEKGTTAPNRSRQAKVASVIGITVAELMTGETPTSSGTMPSSAFLTNPKTAKKVWVVGKGQGGMTERIWTDGEYPVGVTEEYAEIHSTDPHAFLVKVEGSSMWPKFEDGNFALVEPDTEPELEDCVLVRLQTGETMIKRLLSRRHGYKLASFNDPVIHEFKKDEVTWCYYIAHEVPRRKIKSRH